MTGRSADPHLQPDATVIMYRTETEHLQLDPQRIIETVAMLRDRIEERFPGSGLGNLGRRLHGIATSSVTHLERITRPNLPLRLAIGAFILVLAGIFVGIFQAADLPAGTPDFFELVQAVEAALNDLVFVGIAVFFLVTLENRIKRRRALHALRELRALAHIVDMHQLTKDPDRVMQPGTDTPSSPQRQLHRFELARYLDYCSEMLSLVSKLAALYAQTFDDPVVLTAVDEVEGLTSGLSSKIWQKIIILDRTIGETAGPTGDYRAGDDATTRRAT